MPNPQTPESQRPPQAWAEQGAPSLLDQACAKTRQILSDPRPPHIPEAVSAELIERFELSPLTPPAG